MKALTYALLLSLTACQLTEITDEETQPDIIKHLLDKAELYKANTPDSTVFYAKQAIEIAEKMENKAYVGHAKNLLAYAFYQIGSLNKATELLHESLKIFLELNQNSKLAATYELLGEVYLRSESYSLSTINFSEALKKYQEISDEPSIARLLGQLGHVYEKTHLYDSALSYQKKALLFFVQIGDSINLSKIYDNIGSIYEDIGDYTKAKENFDQAYRINISSGRIEELIISVNNLGDIGRKTGKYQEAIEKYLQAYSLANKHNIIYQKKSAAKDLSKTYEITKQYDSAVHYLNISHDLTELIFSDQIASELANAHSVYELEQHQQTIKMLEKQQVNARLTTLTVTVASLTLLLMIIGFSLQTISKNKHLRKLLEVENELSKSELKNTQLNQEKLSAELENRQLKEDQLNHELELKSRSLSRSALHIIQKNELLDNLREDLKRIKKGSVDDIPKKLRKLIKSIELNFSLDDDWQEFEVIFQQVHSSFFDKLKNSYPNLSASDVRLCAMIRLNLHSKEISTIMGISNDSLRIARYRLRKKMGLNKGANLYSFILNLDSRGINMYNSGNQLDTSTG